MVVTIERQMNMIQCTLVGDGMVGKTCLSLAFARSSAPALGEYVATVFENYAGKSSVNGDDYTVSIFDSAGQHDYESLRRFTYEDSEVFVVCYSTVDRDSFESVRDFWLPEMKKNMNRKRPIILVATQTDLRNTMDYDCDVPVSITEGTELAREIGALTHVECSVNSPSSVKAVFAEVVQAALKYRKRKSNIVNKFLGR